MAAIRDPAHVCVSHVLGLKGRVPLSRVLTKSENWETELRILVESLNK